MSAIGAVTSVVTQPLTTKPPPPPTTATKPPKDSDGDTDASKPASDQTSNGKLVDIST